MTSLNWQFGALAMFGFDVTVARPPWDFALYSEARRAKSSKAHYVTMLLDAIAALRVGDRARGDCLLLLWCCERMPPAGRQTVLDVWGFICKPSLMWWKTITSGDVFVARGCGASNVHKPMLLAN